MNRLKMTAEHQAIMRAALSKWDAPSARAHYLAAGLSDKRYRWDLLRASGMLDFICDVLYQYLDDEHIGNAVKTMVKPLNES